MAIQEGRKTLAWAQSLNIKVGPEGPVMGDVVLEKEKKAGKLGFVM
ncbi:hypothetical protein predicted by Glimmer/Critica [Acetobacter ghanensis]|uniref:Uncharacterized protein n=1 Tax=Acetobacter ghanensis TaxID=431306 RepID=A0A0U5F0X6_9PROT|nr:hypothetical protein AA18895_0533 [Acetobacter ghanensis DSM 18895]CEF54207.1 hypothetical protein predicted by Glimmer/Critica [Acetobacter ghanensis]